MRNIVNRLKNSAFTGAIVVGVFAAAPFAQGGARVAIIDTNQYSPSLGQRWCDYLAQIGNQCTVFPTAGPTSSLDPFTVLIDLSEIWSDPNGEIADFLHAGKGVILWNNAPAPLGFESNPTVRAWLGMSQLAGGSDRLSIIATDPITVPLVSGTYICDCPEEPCAALAGPTGDVKLIAQYSRAPGPYGIVRNSWEGGKTVFLPDCIQEPYVIVANAVRELDTGIPATSGVGLAVLFIALPVAGYLVLRYSY